MTVYTVLPTPVDELLLTSDGAGLTGVFFRDHVRGPGPDPSWTRDDAALAGAAAQLAEYFAGARTTFDLPLAPRGTPFQRGVWAQLARIPFGATTSYGELAAALGAPGASRAVGLANGRNPLSVVVPCHRVVGAHGRLTGYGGGIARKAWLLDHEARLAGTRLVPMALSA